MTDALDPPAIEPSAVPAKLSLPSEKGWNRIFKIGQLRPNSQATNVLAGQSYELPICSGTPCRQQRSTVACFHRNLHFPKLQLQSDLRESRSLVRISGGPIGFLFNALTRVRLILPLVQSDSPTGSFP